jgi:hypothetical protein
MDFCVSDAVWATMALTSAAGRGLPSTKTAGPAWAADARATHAVARMKFLISFFLLKKQG